jgi:hypothetical protein
MQVAVGESGSQMSESRKARARTQTRARKRAVVPGSRRRALIRRGREVIRVFGEVH